MISVVEIFKQLNNCKLIAIYIHIHSRFTALLEFVQDHPGEQLPER